MTKVCICQICNCGRHKCPHKVPADRSNGPCVLSEYTNRYHPHPMEATKSFKPVTEPYHGDGPISDDTTHRVDYKSHPLEKPFVHQGEQYVQPEGVVDSLTTHKRDFTPKATERVKPAKKDYTRRSPGRFEGDPTYKADYRKWSMPRTEKITHDPGYRPPSASFKGDATYTSDYIKHLQPVRQSIRPARNANTSDQPFDGQTGYRDEFVKHPLPPRELKEKPTYNPNTVPLDGLSNYRKDFVPKDMQRQGNCKPDPKPYQSDAPFNNDTTHKTDYKPWETDRPYQHKPAAYERPEGNFDHNTTTHNDFTKKPIDRRQLVKPEGARRTPGQFEGTTNYNVDFRKWTPESRPKMTMKNGYAPPEAPFEGETNYHDDFIKHRQAPRHTMKPIENSRSSDQPFAETTGYRDEFIKHPLEAKQAREKPKWGPNPAKLDGLSNYMQDFVPKEGLKQNSCKPEAGAYQSDAPFNNDTTHKTDYKPWETDRPYQHKPDAYTQPEGNFDHNTTTHNDFTKKPIDRRQLVKPEGARRTPGQFEGTTNYNVDFRKWTPESRPKMTMKNGYAPPEAPFEGESNYHDDFIKHNQAPTLSLRPNNKGHQSDAPFESGTEYRKEFTKKARPECPAVTIETNPPAKSGYYFADQDERGHKWYQPVSTSYMELPRNNSAGVNKQLTALSVA